MESLIREKTRELFYYFLSIKKNIDNQSKILNLQERDILKLEDFEEDKPIDSTKNEKLHNFIKSKKSDRDIFISRGIIAERGSKKKYPFILKRYFQVENERQLNFDDKLIKFPLETMPKNLSSDYELITLQRQFVNHSFMNFNDNKLVMLANLIKIKIRELQRYYIEDGFFIIKRAKDNKLIYSELNNLISNLNDNIKLPPVFAQLFNDSITEEVACSIDSGHQFVQDTVIEGPAGCGKSEKVIGLTLKLLSQGKRVLITSPRYNGLQQLEKRFLKDIKPLIFSVYSDEVNIEKYKNNFEEIKRRSNFELTRLRKIVDNIKRDNTFSNKYASNLNKKLYEYSIKAIDLIEELDYEYLDIVFRKSDVLIDIPPKSEIVFKIIEFNKRRHEIEQHYEMLKNWKVTYEVDYDEKNLISTINYGKALINEIKGSCGEGILLESNNDKFLEELSKYIFSLKNKIYNIKNKLDITEEEHKEFDGDDFSLIEKKLKLLNIYKELDKDKAKYYLEILCIKKELIAEFNSQAKKYGYEEITNDEFNSIGKTLEQLTICINWNSNIEMNIKKYLGSIGLYNDIKLNTIEELDNLVTRFKSVKEINKYYKVLNYIEKLKMSLFIEEDFKELFLAIKELNVYKVDEQYILIDRLRELLPKVMLLKSYLNKLYDVLQIPIDKILKMYSAPKERWEAVSDALKKYIYGNKDNSTNYNEDISDSNDKMMMILKCWYHFLNGFKQQHNIIFEQWFDGEKERINDIRKVFNLCIMPINKVLELIPPIENEYDVIVIEDCNQCEIAYLSLLLRGKNFIITGDEKQYIPQFSGIDKKIIENNLTVYFKEEKHIQEFNYFNNLFQLLEKHAAIKIPLKYQYRSNASITALLNEIFYENEIISTIKDNPKFKAINSIYVEGALRDKEKIINYKEAMAIVEQIENCIKNPIYDNKTIGVISLLGNEQGDLINKLLKEKIGDDEFEKRKLVCGDFYCLQGEERDIVFLSMVVGNNVKFIAQTKENDYKRFNHALSRAKEQLWLFHSVNLNDINKDCIRYKILQYFIEEKSSESETA